MMRIAMFIMANLIVLTAVSPKFCLASENDTSPMHLGVAKFSRPDVFEHAKADFESVLRGKKPIFAKLPKDAVLLLDGGTTTYKTEGYLLTVQRSLGRLGAVDGVFYGPILVFDKGIAAGSYDKVSRVEFYSTSELKKLLSDGL